jgi:hypothetical protein
MTTNSQVAIAAGNDKKWEDDGSKEQCKNPHDNDGVERKERCWEFIKNFSINAVRHCGRNKQ